MQSCLCRQCGRSLPQGESFLVFEQTLCQKCAEAALAGAGAVPKGAVSRNIDPTVCCNCGMDAGSRPLPLLASLPTCDTCRDFFRNRPFPRWVKLFAAGVLAAVLFVWLWNGRFVLAHIELKQGARACAADDVENAAALFTSASKRVPECRDLDDLSAYYNAIALLRQDKNREALDTIEPHASKLPPSWRADELVMQARLGMAFDEGRYNDFLCHAEKLLAAAPNDPTRLATVASACACKYATTGDEAFRARALSLLTQARAGDSSPEMADYEMRIRYRLHSREIIRQEEFQKRFPNGWKAPEAAP
jgi:hypothetical protein